ncbi:hypothetical protein GYMLUDRAFT_250023 [Collybiopsis luxurians FD-317 M1]|uniref:Uncharacterized protein n=1 Tax=Collybiopsis luxurians FD-317 M1 TaxID=944289 RepID=A0A0D0ATM3_9AGAR|nr:hypothetical protein GYMLUDRAFT_250023 [Collybiopsis luxurians FD-317 M1]
MFFNRPQTPERGKKRQREKPEENLQADLPSSKRERISDPSTVSNTGHSYYHPKFLPPSTPQAQTSRQQTLTRAIDAPPSSASNNMPTVSSGFLDRDVSREASNAGHIAKTTPYSLEAPHFSSSTSPNSPLSQEGHCATNQLASFPLSSSSVPIHSPNLNSEVSLQRAQVYMCKDACGLGWVSLQLNLTGYSTRNIWQPIQLFPKGQTPRTISEGGVFATDITLKGRPAPYSRQPVPSTATGESYKSLHVWRSTGPHHSEQHRQSSSSNPSSSNSRTDITAARSKKRVIRTHGSDRNLYEAALPPQSPTMTTLANPNIGPFEDESWKTIEDWVSSFSQTSNPINTGSFASSTGFAMSYDSFAPGSERFPLDFSGTNMTNTDATARTTEFDPVARIVVNASPETVVQRNEIHPENSSSVNLVPTSEQSDVDHYVSAPKSEDNSG